MTATITLTAHDGPLRGARYEFAERDAALIGRAPDCLLALPPDDPTASRHHCVLEFAPPRAWIRDLGSRNGTWLNARALGPHDGAVALSAGDWIRVGDTLLRVSRDRGDDATLPLSPPHDEPAAGGLQVPGHDLHERLGGGGGGVVHRAVRRSDGAVVAVKLLTADGGASGYAQATFLREVAAMRALRHPHIVALHDHGVVGQTFFFTMELCDGGSAQDLLGAHPHGLPAARACAIALDALAGLAAAHRAGFVHRDVKPGNVLLDGGVAKLGDLGLAKCFARAGLSGVTVAGAMAGTLAYMPREQVTEYRALRPASDVWSAAATLYALITGVAPRESAPGRDPLATVLGASAVPIRRRAPSVPEPVAAVIDRALCDDVAARPADAGELREALAAALP